MTALQNSVYNTQGNCYEQDSYDYTEAVTETKTTKKAAKKTTKTVSVVLMAFTGMVIGTYTTEMTKTGCKIIAKNSNVLEFNAEGVQTNAKNPKFGNKIEIVEA